MNDHYWLVALLRPFGIVAIGFGLFCIKKLLWPLFPPGRVRDALFRERRLGGSGEPQQGRR
jgi:hypothetical protein